LCDGGAGGGEEGVRYPTGKKAAKAKRANRLNIISAYLGEIAEKCQKIGLDSLQTVLQGRKKRGGKWWD